MLLISNCYFCRLIQIDFKQSANSQVLRYEKGIPIISVQWNTDRWCKIHYRYLVENGSLPVFVLRELPTGQSILLHLWYLQINHWPPQVDCAEGEKWEEFQVWKFCSQLLTNIISISNEWKGKMQLDMLALLRTLTYMTLYLLWIIMQTYSKT